MNYPATDGVLTVLLYMDAAEHAESLGLELEPTTVGYPSHRFVIRRGTDSGDVLASLETLTEVGLWLDGCQAATDGGDA